MAKRKSTTRRVPLIIVGGAIPVALILGHLFGMSLAIEIPIVLVLGLVFGSMLLWAAATSRADGSEWWQDDSASGWRGY